MGRERRKDLEVGKMDIPDSGKSKCKGPEAGKHIIFFQEIKHSLVKTVEHAEAKGRLL